MEAQPPSKWKGLSIKLYDGSTDPDEHLNIYQMQMNLYTTNKAVREKVFPTSLQEGALNWFTQLPPNLVDSFKTLMTKFSTQYTTSRLHHMSSLALFNIRQEKGGTLAYVHGEI